MKITKRQLKRIIKEEKAKILKEQMTPDSEVMDRLEEGLAMIALDMILNRGDAALKAEVEGYVMDTSTSDPEQVAKAMQDLARRHNL